MSGWACPHRCDVTGTLPAAAAADDDDDDDDDNDYYDVCDNNVNYLLFATRTHSSVSSQIKSLPTCVYCRRLCVIIYVQFVVNSFNVR